MPVRYYRKNEFRYGKRNSRMGRHPVYVSAELGNKYRVNVITHSRQFFNRSTYRLFDNPNKNNNQIRNNRFSRISVPVVVNKNDVTNYTLSNWYMSTANKKIQRKVNRRNYVPW